MRPEWRNKQMAFPFHSCTHGQPETPTHNTLPAAEGVSRCALFQSSNTCGRSYMSRDPLKTFLLFSWGPQWQQYTNHYANNFLAVVQPNTTPELCGHTDSHMNNELSQIQSHLW